MKKYTLKTNNRQPIQFVGELLGESSSKTTAEIVAELEKESSQLPSVQTHAKIKLALYRTSGGKVILYTTRWILDKQAEMFSGTSASIDVYEDFNAYIESARDKRGKVGSVTVALMENVVKTHPELEEHWVEKID